MHSFPRKINFVRRFIYDFNLKWTKERREAFDKIKEAMVEDPTLQSLNFDNEFMLYIFASDHSIIVVLTQNNEKGEKFPVSFMSTGLEGVELNYLAIDK